MLTPEKKAKLKALLKAKGKKVDIDNGMVDNAGKPDGDNDADDKAKGTAKTTSKMKGKGKKC